MRVKVFFWHPYTPELVLKVPASQNTASANKEMPIMIFLLRQCLFFLAKRLGKGQPSEAGNCRQNLPYSSQKPRGKTKQNKPAAQAPTQALTSRSPRGAQPSTPPAGHSVCLAHHCALSTRIVPGIQ